MGRVFRETFFKQRTTPTQQLVNLDVDDYVTLGKMDRLPFVINLNVDHYATVGKRVFPS